MPTLLTLEVSIPTPKFKIGDTVMCVAPWPHAGFQGMVIERVYCECQINPEFGVNTASVYGGYWRYWVHGETTRHYIQENQLILLQSIAPVEGI